MEIIKDGNNLSTVRYAVRDNGTPVKEVITCIACAANGRGATEIEGAEGTWFWTKGENVIADLSGLVSQPVFNEALGREVGGGEILDDAFYNVWALPLKAGYTETDKAGYDAALLKQAQALHKSEGSDFTFEQWAEINGYRFAKGKGGK